MLTPLKHINFRLNTLKWNNYWSEAFRGFSGSMEIYMNTKVCLKHWGYEILQGTFALKIITLLLI